MIEGSKDREQPDVLGSTDAGGLAIRGGMVRIGGYFGAIALALVAIPLLTRHLGVDDFGRYITVLSIIAIAGLISDAGLTVVGVREYATRDQPGRIRLVRNLVGLRVVIAVAGGAGATLFTLVAGYSDPMVVGTALAGIGLVFTVLQQAYTLPLQTELRLGLVTALDLARHALTVVWVLVLVLVGAGLVAFLAIPIPVGLAVAAAAALVLRPRSAVRPAFDRAEWRYLTREALPVAVASTIGSFFYRIAIIVMSLIATAEQTGYFSASFRIVEAIIVIPGLLTAAAFPIVARAAHDDHERLSYALERLFEMAVILGTWTSVCVVLGAGPAITFVGGSEFDPAEPVLRVQGIALALSYLVAVWATGLWALREQRALAWANVVGVATAGLLTALLVSASDSDAALGAAVAMTIAEALLATIYAFTLMRGRPYLRPSLALVPKTLAAALPAIGLWFAPVPDVAKVVLATILFYGVLWALRGIPTEVTKAIGERRSGHEKRSITDTTLLL
jgi:O-antigen/teichoic acid export membrane protein